MTFSAKLEKWYCKSVNAKGELYKLVITNCDWDNDLVLSKDDFTLMEKFLALLKPIKKMADLLNSENYSTIHMVLPTIKDIKNHIDGFKNLTTISGNTYLYQ